MDGKIYNTLKQIDSLKVAKFGLNKNRRIFLKKLLLDQSFLDDEIRKNKSTDNFLERLKNILKTLTNIDDKLKVLKASDAKEETKKILDTYFDSDFEDRELRKDALIEEFVSFDIKKKNIKKYDEERMNDIILALNKLP